MRSALFWGEDQFLANFPTAVKVPKEYIFELGFERYWVNFRPLVLSYMSNAKLMYRYINLAFDIKWQKDSAGRTFKLRKCLKWIKNSKIDQKFKNGEKIGTFWIRYTNGSEPFCTVAETPILIGFDDLAFLYCILEGFQIWKSENWKSENRKILASGFFRNLSKSIPQAGGAP